MFRLIVRLIIKRRMGQLRRWLYSDEFALIDKLYSRLEGARIILHTTSGHNHRQCEEDFALVDRARRFTNR